MVKEVLGNYQRESFFGEVTERVLVFIIVENNHVFIVVLFVILFFVTVFSIMLMLEIFKLMIEHGTVPGFEALVHTSETSFNQVVCEINILILKHIGHFPSPPMLPEQLLTPPKIGRHTVRRRPIILTRTSPSRAHVGIEHHVAHQVIPDALPYHLIGQQTVVSLNFIQVHFTNFMELLNTYSVKFKYRAALDQKWNGYDDEQD